MIVKTSVVIPVYNTASLLPQCLESVLNQTQKELEIIAVDDGSTDNSLEILYEYQNQYDNIKILSQGNRRQGAARNAGVSCASGKYIYFLDSDDYIEAETLDTCYRLAERQRLDIVLFDADVVYEDVLPPGFQPDSFDRRQIIKETERIYSGPDFLAAYMDTVPDTVSPCMMYISKALIDKNHVSFMPGVYYEDEDYRLQIMLKAERIMYIPKLFYNRRYRAGSTMTSGYSLESMSDLLEVVGHMIESLSEKEVSHITCQYIRKRMWMLLDYANFLEKDEKNSELSNKILEVLRRFWKKFSMPNDMEDIQFRLFYIKCMNDIFSGVSWESELNLAQTQRIVMLRRLKLDDPKLRVGILGDRERYDELLNAFREYVGAVAAEIFHIDKLEELTGNLVNLLDYIILVSDNHESDISGQLRRLYSKILPICVLCAKDGGFLL